MHQLQSPTTTRQSSLICTRILRKYKSPSQTPNQKIKTITHSANKIDEKEERKIQYQLSVKGKTMIRQAYEQKGQKKKVRSVIKKQQSKQDHFWLGSAAISPPGCIKYNQNLLSTLQVSKHTQILTFYHTNVFACHNQHNRFNKILKKKYCTPTSKTQYYPQQSQESFSQAHRNLSLKHDLNKSSKIVVRRSSLLFTNQTKGSQLFEPRLKYKKRPKSVDNNKRYKMNSLFVKLRKNSIAEVDKNMNVEHAHIEPLKYQDQTQLQMTFDDQKIVTLKQPPSLPLQQTRRNVNVIIKTKPSPPRIKSRSRQKETILTSSRGINPWSDQQWRAKNIFDEQINVKLLS